MGMEINVAAVESSMEAAQKLSPELACDAAILLLGVPRGLEAETRRRLHTCWQQHRWQEPNVCHGLSSATRVRWRTLRFEKERSPATR